MKGSGPRLLRASEEALDELVDLVAGLDDSSYTTSVPALGLSPVGAHCRHVYDFYRCLVGGRGDGRVDYQARGRDRRIEGEREAALAAFRRLRDELACLEPVLEAPVLIKAELDDGGGAVPWTVSTFGRELNFLLGHLTHHLALVAVALKALGVATRPWLGVAPSTRRHREAARA